MIGASPLAGRNPNNSCGLVKSIDLAFCRVGDEFGVNCEIAGGLLSEDLVEAVRCAETLDDVASGRSYIVMKRSLVVSL